MSEYPPVMKVYSVDTAAYLAADLTEELYQRLCSLTAQYKKEYLAARDTYETECTQLDLELTLEDDTMRPFIQITTDSSKLLLLYELRLKLLRYTRRFQGNLYRFGLAGTQTHIAVCDSLVTLGNQATEVRKIALRHDLPVADMHLEYH